MLPNRRGKYNNKEKVQVKSINFATMNQILFFANMFFDLAENKKKKNLEE